MDSQNNVRDAGQFLGELKECSESLVEKLQNDNYEAASDVINQLIEARDRHIFRSVGLLTRALHDAIVNFNVEADFSTDPASVTKSEISDASDRLEHVITMTQTAAEKTMDRVEAAAPIAQDLGDEAAKLKSEWERLRKRQITKEEFAELYARIDVFLDKMGEGTTQVNENLQAIILEQGFQDLTGQVLKKVIGLVKDVEKELVNLMRIAGQVEMIPGMPNEEPLPQATRKKDELEGPQLNAKDRDDVVSGQDDVDDLLSSLGF